MVGNIFTVNTVKEILQLHNNYSLEETQLSPKQIIVINPTTKKINVNIYSESEL